MFIQKKYQNYFLTALIAFFFGALGFLFFKMRESAPSLVLKRGRLIDSIEHFELKQERPFDTERLLLEMFEGLVCLKNGSIEPANAKKWHSQDEKIWQFELRSGLKWSDGSPLTALDYVSGFQKIFEAAKNNLELAKKLEKICALGLPILNSKEVLNNQLPPTSLGIQAISPNIFQIELVSSRRSSLVLRALTKSYFFPTQTNNMFEISPLLWHVNGPFKVVSIEIENAPGTCNEKKSTWIFEKNKYYKNFKKIKIEKLEHHFFESKRACDHAWAQQLIDSLELDDRAHLQHFQSNLFPTGQQSIWELVININDGILKNQSIRECVAQSLPRTDLAYATFLPGSSARYSPVKNTRQLETSFPAWHFFSTADRIKKVENLLKQKGFSKENPLVLEILYTETPIDIKEVEKILNESLPFLKLNWTHLPNTLFLDRLKTGQFQIYLRENKGALMPFVNYQFFISGANENFGQCNKLVTQKNFETFNSASASAPYDLKIYKDLELKFFRLWPSIPLFSEPHYMVVSQRLDYLPFLIDNPSGIVRSLEFSFSRKSQTIEGRNAAMAEFFEKKRQGLSEEEAHLFFW